MHWLTMDFPPKGLEIGSLNVVAVVILDKLLNKQYICR